MTHPSCEPPATAGMVSAAEQAEIRALAPYLNGGHADLPPDQDPAVLEGGHVGFLQLHEVCNQVGDVDLPVGAEQVAELAPWASALGHELGEDAHGGVLVLQGTAAATPLLLVLVLTLSRGSGERGEALRSQEWVQRRAGVTCQTGRGLPSPPRDASQAGASGARGSAGSTTGGTEAQTSLSRRRSLAKDLRANTDGVYTVQSISS